MQYPGGLQLIFFPEQKIFGIWGNPIERLEEKARFQPRMRICFFTAKSVNEAGASITAPICII